MFNGKGWIIYIKMVWNVNLFTPISDKNKQLVCKWNFLTPTQIGFRGYCGKTKLVSTGFLEKLNTAGESRVNESLVSEILGVALPTING